MGRPRVFLRCNSGHYFCDSACPFDGWSMDGYQDVVIADLRLADKGEPPSIERLRAEGIPEGVLARTAVIEFGSEASAFEALDPAGFIVGDVWVPIRSASRHLK
jgi:hypothetical protein